MKNKKEKNQIKTMVSIPMLVIMIMVVLISSIGTSYAATYIFNSKDVGYDNQKSGIQSDNVQGAIDELYSSANDYSNIIQRLNTIETQIYPVGSIYISVSNTNPSTLFGGTWVAFGSGKTLVGIDTNDTDFDTAEESHGSKTVTLSTSNLPSHSHYYTPSGTVSQPTFTGTAVTSSANNRGHTHSVTAAGTVTSSFSGTRTTTENAGDHQHYLVANGEATATLSGNNYLGIYATTSHTDLPYSLRGTSAGASIGRTSTNGSHLHYFTPSGSVSSSFKGSAVTSGGESQNHTHSVTAAGTVSQPTFSGTKSQTEATGSGTAFSTMDPYITVYMWKRTA